MSQCHEPMTQCHEPGWSGPGQDSKGDRGNGGSLFEPPYSPFVKNFIRRLPSEGSSANIQLLQMQTEVFFLETLGLALRKRRFIIRTSEPPGGSEVQGGYEKGSTIRHRAPSTGHSRSLDNLDMIDDTSLE